MSPSPLLVAPFRFSEVSWSGVAFPYVEWPRSMNGTMPPKFHFEFVAVVNPEVPVPVDGLALDLLAAAYRADRRRHAGRYCARSAA